MCVLYCRRSGRIGKGKWLPFSWNELALHKHHQDTCLEEIELRLWVLITTLHLIVNACRITYASSQEINKMHFNMTIAKFGRSDFQSNFCICFIIDLLMQHDLCCINLIGRSWRTWKTNQTTPANIYTLGPLHISQEPFPWSCESPKERV